VRVSALSIEMRAMTPPAFTWPPESTEMTASTAI
jgi:hypothetical protein